MSHCARCDGPDTWHHVTNRGIARRTMFEGRADVRRFLARVARQVRRGTIEVHAYCVMTTHFHLLVRSPLGRLSEALQQMEGVYARWFNRGRRRDGSLVRARFKSVPVTSAEHWGACVAYIDRNPVDAHIVARPTDYPWGSASHYARAAGPRWLTRDRVEALVADRGGLAAFDPARYAEIVMATWPPETMEWVERALARRPRVDPSLDDLVGAAPQEVRAWMARKARLADGTSARTVVAAVSVVDRAVRSAAAVRPDWTVLVRGRRRSAWQAMKAGLLRSCTGATFAEIAAIEGISDQSVRRRTAWHEEAIRTDSGYGDVAVRILAATFEGESVGKVSDTVPTLGESVGNVSGTVPTLTSRGR